MHMELTHPCGATPSGVLAAVPSAPAALQASWGCDLGPQRASARHPTWGQRLPHGLCPLRQRKGLGTPAQGLHSLPSLPWLQRVGSCGQAAFTIPGPHNPSAQSSRLRLLQPRKSRSHTTSLAVGSWPGTAGSAGSQGHGVPGDLHGHACLGGLDDGHKASSLLSPPSLASHSRFERKGEKIGNGRESGECSIGACGAAHQCPGE